MTSKQKIREIYEILPKLNCGFCGFGGCGQFARAVVEGRASPFGCWQAPWLGYRISEMLGLKAPAYSFSFAFAPQAEPTPSLEALRREVGELSRRAADILDRIEKLRLGR